MVKLLFFLYGLLLFLVGASYFSFLNVVIYRVPLGLPLTGRSFCPQCGKTLGAWEMIPCLSWLLLRGRCHSCGGAISPRYILVEALGGGAGLVCVAAFGQGGTVPGFTLQGGLALVALGILSAVALVDADTQEIPDGLVWALLGCGVAAVCIFPQVEPLSRVIGFFCVSVPMLLVALAVPGGFGGGDMKLMAAVGVLLGWKAALCALFLAILSGGSYGAWLLISGKKGRKEQFAFGPFLCGGTALAFFYGEALVDWYVGLL